MRSPGLRDAVIKGYRNLAIIIVGTMTVLAPLALHPGLKSAQLVLSACAILTIGLALWQRFVSGAWNAYFASAVAVIGLLLIPTAYLLNTGWKNLFIPITLAGIWFGLPKIAERNARGPK